MWRPRGFVASRSEGNIGEVEGLLLEFIPEKSAVELPTLRRPTFLIAVVGMVDYFRESSGITKNRRRVRRN